VPGFFCQYSAGRALEQIGMAVPAGEGGAFRGRLCLYIAVLQYCSIVENEKNHQ